MDNITSLRITAEGILKEAQKEVNEEKAKKAKTQIKTKLAQIEAAKLVVDNLNRELEVLIEQVNAELK